MVGRLRVPLALAVKAALFVVTAGYSSQPGHVLHESDNEKGSPCSGNYTIIDGTSGRISDGCWPRYEPNMNCHWWIAPKMPNAGSLILKIESLSLETGYDFLNVTDGKGTLLGTFTGRTIPPPIMSPTGILQVTFKSDASSHARGYGFRSALTGFNASFSFVQALASVCPNSCSGHGTCKKKTSASEPGHTFRCQCEDGWWGGDCSVNTCVGTVFSSKEEGTLGDWRRDVNTWNSDNTTSTNSQDCRWVITPNTVKSSLTLQLWTLNLEKGREFLWVYDGDSWHSPLLAQLSANDEWSNNSLGKRQAPIIRSTSGKLFLHYKSDSMAFRTGFYASWSTTQRCTDFCKHGTCVGEHCVCQEGWYGGDCSSRYCTGSTYLTARRGSISDHYGDSNYAGYADCRWFIRPTDPINFITFRFTHFVLEGGMDFLYLHDGANESAPMRMFTYVKNWTIDTALTGDGLHRVVPLIGNVERFVYTQHHMAMSKAKQAYLHFKSDMNDNNITLKYPGLLDTSTYGPGQRIGFRVEYEGVYCAGITHIYTATGTITDGSGSNMYHGGQRCLWVLHPPSCEIPGRSNALPSKTCTTAPSFEDRVVEVTLQDVDIHLSDTLRVLDGDNVNAPVLQSFHNITAKNVVVTSISRTILIEFVTDNTQHAQGFKLAWKSIPKRLVLLPGLQAPYASVQDLSGAPVNRPPGITESTMCKRLTFLRNLTETIQDHVGPSTSYQSNMLCQWNIDLPDYTEQMEWWVLRMDLHPGRSAPGLNTSGQPSQLNVIQVGPADHQEADFVSLYKGRHHLEPHETAEKNAWAPNVSQALSNFTGHYTPVDRHPTAVPTPRASMTVINGSRAMVLFKTSAHYVDLGFQMRYQAVFSDPKLCEVWGRGWGTDAQVEVNKAAQFTLRTARYIFPHITDWRPKAEQGTVWKNVLGGAKFVVRLKQTRYDNGTTIHYTVNGSFVDLNSGFYMLSYTAERVGTWTVNVLMDGLRGLEDINGSPFKVKVRTGPTDPRGCRAMDPDGVPIDVDIAKEGVKPGKRIMFRIQAGDAFGNKKKQGGDNFVVKLDGPQPVAGTLKDMKDGTYNASFSVMKAGKYNVFVGLAYGHLHETAIYGSPFKIKVPKLPCPPSFKFKSEQYPNPDICNGEGVCQDDGTCKCNAAYDGEYCQDELNKPYRQVIIFENVVLGSLAFIYVVYRIWTSQGKAKVQQDDGMLGQLDDEEDEEVQFKGWKCCMHW